MKSLYSVHSSLKLVPLFTEMPESLHTKVKSILIFRTQISLAYICKNICNVGNWVRDLCNDRENPTEILLTEILSYKTARHYFPLTLTYLHTLVYRHNRLPLLWLVQLQISEVSACPPHPPTAAHWGLPGPTMNTRKYVRMKVCTHYEPIKSRLTIMRYQSVGSSVEFARA